LNFVVSCSAQPRRHWSWQRDSRRLWHGQWRGWGRIRRTALKAFNASLDPTSLLTFKFGETEPNFRATTSRPSALRRCH